MPGEGLAERRRKEGRYGSVLLVGLGGGALPTFLHRAFGFAVDCVELDETVVALAKKHFGFRDVDSEPHLKVGAAGEVSGGQITYRAPKGICVK
jgi:hypothetical protein